MIAHQTIQERFMVTGIAKSHPFARPVYACVLSLALTSGGCAQTNNLQTTGGEETGKSSVGDIKSLRVTSPILFPGTTFHIVVNGISPSYGKRCDIHYEIKSENGQGNESGALATRVGAFPFPSKLWKFETTGSRTIKVWSSNAQCKGEARLEVSVIDPFFQKTRIGS